MENVVQRNENVDHPKHYGGADDPYEAVKVIEAWNLPWHLGDCLKYVRRAGCKVPEKKIEDLEKARWYLDRYISLLKTNKDMQTINTALDRGKSND